MFSMHIKSCLENSRWYPSKACIVSCDMRPPNDKVKLGLLSKLIMLGLADHIDYSTVPCMKYILNHANIQKKIGTLNYSMALGATLVLFSLVLPACP